MDFTVIARCLTGLPSLYFFRFFKDSHNRFF